LTNDQLASTEKRNQTAFGTFRTWKIRVQLNAPARLERANYGPMCDGRRALTVVASPSLDGHPASAQ